MVSPEDVRRVALTPRMRRRLRKHVRKRMAKLHVEDIIQLTLLAATASESRPPSVEKIEPWLYGIASFKIAKFYDKATKSDTLMKDYFERWETTPSPMSDVNEDKLLVHWLMNAVADDPHDAETLDLVRDHAISGKTYAEIAAERGMAVKAIDNRIGHFKTKYAPLRARYLKRLAWLTFGAILLTSAIACAAYWLGKGVFWQTTGSIAPPKVMATPTPPPPEPSASVFMPSIEPPAPSAPPNGTKGPH
jgi:DNA-directed RNA polymerase specialized sigma24 family protein